MTSPPITHLGIFKLESQARALDTQICPILLKSQVLKIPNRYTSPKRNPKFQKSEFNLLRIPLLKQRLFQGQNLTKKQLWHYQQARGPVPRHCGYL